MQYFMLVIIYTAIMLLIYVVFLRNRPLFAFSRGYLLACAVAPLLLPLIKLPPFLQQQIQQKAAIWIKLPEFRVQNMPVAATQLSWLDFRLLYLIFAGLFIVHNLRSVLFISRLIKHQIKESYGAYTVIKNTGYGPGSFGEYLFFPGSEVNPVILAHEQAHAKFHHTADLLALNILQALFWPNFLIYFIKKELRQVHEFQADSLVDTDPVKYSELLLCSVFNTSSLPLMHSFIIHPLKRRIMMLQKKETAAPAKAVLQVSAALCLFVAAAIGIQSCKKVSTSNSGTSTASDQSVYEKIKLDDSVQKVADVMPNYDGLSEFLGKELHYPEYARKKGIEGRVIVKFVVTKDGAIANPVILKSPDTSLSRAALDVMNKMPRWSPGRMINGKKVNVAFVLPVLFKLD